MKKGRKKRSFGRILGISLMAFALALSAVPAEGVIAEEGGSWSVKTVILRLKMVY